MATTQTYQTGIPFDTYTSAEIAAAGGLDEWTWTGRSLYGYVSADNYSNAIPPGSSLTLHSNAGSLKGCWKLSKLDVSVCIDNQAEDSYVELSGKILQKDETSPSYYYSNCLPLTSEPTTYEIAKRVKDGDVCKFWFNTNLCCVVHPGTNRTVSAVYYDPQSKSIDSQLSISNNGAVHSFEIGSNYADYQQPAICINEMISVFLAENDVPYDSAYTRFILDDGTEDLCLITGNIDANWMNDYGQYDDASDTWAKNIVHTDVGNAVTSIGEFAFASCRVLSSIFLPNSVRVIDEWSFWNCISLLSIAIPNSVTEIGYNVFNSCSNLTNVIIGNGVTDIEEEAFFYAGLSDMTLPNTVSRIGPAAFYGCHITCVTIVDNGGDSNATYEMLLNRDGISEDAQWIM